MHICIHNSVLVVVRFGLAASSSDGLFPFCLHNCVLVRVCSGLAASPPDHLSLFPGLLAFRKPCTGDARIFLENLEVFIESCRILRNLRIGYFFEFLGISGLILP